MTKILREIIAIGTLGDYAVGKSNLTNVFTEKEFQEEHMSTIGVNCVTKNVTIKLDNNESKEIKLKIWDTAGQERFKSISVQYIKNCLGILLVYAIDNEKSFENIETWMKEVEEKSSNKNMCLVLIGNKCDMEEKRMIKKEQGEKLAQRYGLKFFECSAKKGINVNEAFQELIDQIVAIYKDEFGKKGMSLKVTTGGKKSCCGGKNNENK